jgi:hypothetical protein
MQEKNASEIMLDALRFKSRDSKARRYGSWTNWMKKLFRSSPTHFEAMYRYECLLVEIMVERGWEAAEHYHFRAFQCQKEGAHDLCKNPLNLYAFLRMGEKFPLTHVRKSSNSGSSWKFDKGRTPAGEGWIWCDTHGCWGKHSTADCSKSTSDPDKGKTPDQ